MSNTTSVALPVIELFELAIDQHFTENTLCTTPDDSLELDLPSIWQRPSVFPPVEELTDEETSPTRAMGHLVWLISPDRASPVPEAVTDSSGRRWSLVDVGRFIEA